MSIKIVHIARIFQPDIQRWTEKLVFHQSISCDYELEVITTNLNITGAPVYKVGEEIYNGVKIRRLPAIKLRNQFIPLAYKSFKNISCDIIHAHNFGVIFCQIPMLMHKNYPIILKPDLGKIYPNYNFLKFFEIKYVDVATFFNDREKNILKRIGFKEQKIKRVPLGVDYKTFSEYGKKIEPETNKVIVVAEITPIKNIELAIISIANLKDIKLEIVGPIYSKNFYYYERLLKLCETLNVKKRVVFRGAINYKDLPPIYASSKLTLVTSRHESGGPASVIESIAAGRPVISVPLEIVRHLRKYYAEDEFGGIVEVNYDVEEISKTIELLCEDSSFWRKLSKSGQKVAKKISWEETLKEVDKIYKSLLESP